MVVLLDLDGDEYTLDLLGHRREDVPFPHPRFGSTVTRNGKKTSREGEGLESDRPNLNINGFSAALNCYPIVSQLARSLDLNTLHALSRTCRQFRSNLLVSRKQLVAHSLRCSTEEADRIRSHPGSDVNTPQAPRLWVFGLMPNHVPFCKMGACARDMVSDCRNCGQIVCRNCIYKGPYFTACSNRLPDRHRRLCSTCLAAPFSQLTEHSPFSSTSIEPPAFTTPAFTRGPCSCPDAVYLCNECGQALSSADITYKRIWTWRTRYSTNLGGLGTGIGEGNEGVQCGRGKRCLAAEDKEVEIDCRSSESPPSASTPHRTSTPQNRTDGGDLSSDGSDCAGSLREEKAGYLRQEIEGIGGVLKKKIKKRERVGKTVREYEDEREKAEYLGREMRAENRSWCGWCERVIPGVRDIALDGSL